MHIDERVHGVHTPLTFPKVLDTPAVSSRSIGQTGFQAKASDAQLELDKRTSCPWLRSYLKTYAPLLNKAKGMHALKTIASDVLPLGSHLLMQAVKLFACFSGRYQRKACFQAR
jgi:hypothetical protein